MHLLHVWQYARSNCLHFLLLFFKTTLQRKSYYICFTDRGPGKLSAVIQLISRKVQVQIQSCH